MNDEYVKLPIEENKTTKKLRNNPWFTATLFLIILAILLGFNLIEYNNSNEQINETIDNEIGMSIDLDKHYCSIIEGTPAWIKDGEILNYGYLNFGNYSSIIVDQVLIPQNISFYYSSNCGYCHKQVEDFGKEQWTNYVKSGLTVDCLEVLN